MAKYDYHYFERNVTSDPTTHEYLKGAYMSCFFSFLEMWEHTKSEHRQTQEMFSTHKLTNETTATIKLFPC